MTEAIIVALITAASAVVCQLVDKHNSVIARTYKLEQDYALIDEKIKVANHRIDDLERK